MASNNIKELLRRHNYEVSVAGFQDLPYKIRASFPERKELPFCEKFTGTYLCCPKGSTDAFVGVKFKISGKEELVECPEYAMEELIFCNVDIICALIGYDNNLVTLYIDGLEVLRPEFSQSIIDLNLDQNDKLKKDELASLINQAKKQNFSLEFDSLSKEKNVEDGYIPIKKMHGFGEYKL